MIRVRVDKLTLRRTGDVILTDSEFSIGPDDRIAVVGLSGAGKTTLFRLISGTLDRREFDFQGTVTINDREMGGSDLLDWHPIRGNVLRNLYQDPVRSLSPSVKLGFQADTARHLIRRKALPEEDRNRLGRDFGIPDSSPLLKRFPGNVSGGQLQRMGIMITLQGTGDVLLIDEPTNSLDMTNVARFYSYLNSLADSGVLRSYLIISHDLSALNILDVNRIILIDSEKLSHFTPDEFRKSEYSQSYRDYERRLSAAARPAEPAGAKPAPRKPVLLVDIGSYVYRPDFLSFQTPFRLKDIRFKVAAGEFLGILGNSGMGKSTLIKCILNVRSGYDGKIRVSDPEPVQYINQASAESFDPYTTLQGHLRECAESRGLGWEEQVFPEILDLMRRFEMPEELLHKNAEQLSGGQRQILSYIRAVMGGPRLLIADEPFTNLDFRLKLKLYKDLMGRKAAGLGMLLVSHDIQLMTAICDNFIFMEDGRLQGGKFAASRLSERTETPIREFAAAMQSLAQPADRT